MLQLDLRTNLALVFMYIKELHLSNTQSKVNIPGQLICRFSEKKRKEKTDVVKLFHNQLFHCYFDINSCDNTVYT